MQVLTDRISDFRSLISDSVQVEVKLNTRVMKLERQNPDATTWRVQTGNDESLETDAVCVAVPSYTAADLVSEFAPQLSTKLREIEFASTATINFAYRRRDVTHKLDGFGFVVPRIENRSLIACSFSSVKFARRAPDDHALLRAFVGGALQPEMLKLSDDDIVSRVENDLRELLGATSKPLFADVARWENSMPQYAVGHLARVDEIETEASKFPGLALAGNAYRGAGIPDCIRSGERAAEILMNR
jgi:oxygen-dependent protoporphyrinogen oxidase